MADLATVVTAFERLFQTVSEGPAQAYNQHGEIYVTLCSGGIKKEMGLLPAMYASAADAVDAWWGAASDYFASTPGRHLYWRHRPTLEAETLPLRGDPYHFVVSRLVVSMQPPPAKPLDGSGAMLRYRCHKLVEAAPIIGWFDPNAITAQGPHVTVGSGANTETVNVPNTFFARGIPAVGDYLVRYEDGYLSWSPKKAFEDGYSAIAEDEGDAA